MITKRILIPLLFSILIVTIFIPILMSNQAHAQFAYPKIYVSPKNYYGTVGENINVSIAVSGAINAFLIQASVNYSSELLSVVRIIEGDFLKRGGAYTTFWRAVNNTPGLIVAIDSLVLGGQPVSGSGELFIITFKVNKPGGCVLHLFNIVLYNQFGALIRPLESEDGLISTTKLEFTPNLVRAGPTFNVNVTLEGSVENFKKFDLEITYDWAILNVTSATILNIIGTPNASEPIINATEEGKVKLAMTLESSTNSTGALATIAFSVIQLGSVDVSISDSTLTDQSGNAIIHVLGKMSFTNLVRNIAIIDAVMASYEATAGDNIAETITLKNDGTMNETTAIVTHALDTRNNITALVGGPTTLNMTAESNTTITITLNTIGLDGNYTLHTFIFYVPDETTIQDNEWTATQQLRINPKPEEAPSIFGTNFYMILAVVVIIIIVVALYFLKRKPRT